MPALIRGLFMTGRGADIYSAVPRLAACRSASRRCSRSSTRIEHKNAALEADAKKYEFRPGVIEQKTALVLGDLRAKEAVPAMLAELKKPQKGDNHTRRALSRSA